MKKLVQIYTLPQLIELNKIACSVPEDVTLSCQNGRVTANAKSGLNLFALDLTGPIMVESGSQTVMDALEKLAVTLP